MSPRELELNDAAHRAGFRLHISSTERRHGRPGLRLFKGRDRVNPVAAFASVSAALAWLEQQEVTRDPA